MKTNTKKVVISIVLPLVSVTALALSSCADSTSASAGVTASNSVKPYPKDTCVVTGNKLGSMGDPVTLVHGDQEMKFCCNPCVKKFKANPDKYLAQL